VIVTPAKAGARFLLLAALALPAGAASFRWAAAGDHVTADPHAQDAQLTNSINLHVYEPLLMRGKRLELLPALAERWEQVAPTEWRFHLRRGVKWHDGTAFTADDVVFSFARAAGRTSNYRAYATAVGTPRALDAHTVVFTTPAPNPIQLEMLAGIAVMSRAWCEKHRSTAAQDFAAREETYAARHANGTGPFRLLERVPDVQSRFEKNRDWWGIAAGHFEGNVESMTFSTLRSDATRMAGLRSGSLDLVHDPPAQDVAALRRDPQLRVIEGRESFVVFLGMDQAREALAHGGAKGRNPFKDKRVRQAVYHAIDAAAIDRIVNRGFSVATAVPLPDPVGAGIPEGTIRRYPHDEAAARRLLAEAGWAEGFAVTLDCLNSRDKACIAVAGMLARVNIRVNVNSMASPQFLAKGQRRDTSFYMLGWGSGSPDALFLLPRVFHGRDGRGDGDGNWGDYRDPELDAIIDRAKVEMDTGKRQELVRQAMRRVHDNVYYIPLHHRISPWAARANVEAVHRANNHIHATSLRIR
jgi:peptide/nickel transport system substrate-binding protein